MTRCCKIVSYRLWTAVWMAASVALVAYFSFANTKQVLADLNLVVGNCTVSAVSCSKWNSTTLPKECTLMDLTLTHIYTNASGNYSAVIPTTAPVASCQGVRPSTGNLSSITMASICNGTTWRNGMSYPCNYPKDQPLQVQSFPTADKANRNNFYMFVSLLGCVVMRYAYYLRYVVPYLASIFCCNCSKRPRGSVKLL